MKLELENWHLKKCINYLNTYRLGDEIIQDNDESSAVQDFRAVRSDELLTNTRNFQLDGSFANIYFYITDVSNDYLYQISFYYVFFYIAEKR